MEISHRSDAFVGLAETAERKLRALMNIPDDYAVLFCHGSATHQFAMIPMNLLADGKTADYLNTGIWSDKAVKEAKKYFDEAGYLCAQILVTKEDFRDRGHYTNMKACFENLLRENVIPVVNENDPIAASGVTFTFAPTPRMT